jgi:hypothetical protein
MKVSGEEAKSYDAVRLDTYMSVNGRGYLIEADEITGNVIYKDTPDTQKTIVLGMNAIKIVLRKR